MPKRKRTESEPTESESDGSSDNESDSVASDEDECTKKIKGSSASQIRSRLRDRVKRDVDSLPYGDIVIYVNIPSSRQGQLVVVHSPMPAQQLLAALQGVQKQLPRPDARLDERIDELKKAVALMKGTSVG